MRKAIGAALIFTAISSGALAQSPAPAKPDPQLQATLDVLQDRLMMAFQKDINTEIASRAARQELAAEKARADALAAWWAGYVKGLEPNNE